MEHDLDVYLSAILEGDTRAFGRWMAAAELTIRDSLRSFVTVVDVEAVLQESLLRVWQVRARFERDGKANGLLRLALRIARNLAVSEVRRLKARPVPDEDLERAMMTAATFDESSEADPMLRGVLAECHQRLPEKPRQALDARLAGEGGKPDEDLAEAIGMRLNTFLQNFGRARKLLAECLKKHGVRIEEGLGA
jgi:RNA polymerase sigma-70 factor (ECF subfamily)